MLKQEIINKTGFLFYNDYWDKYFCKFSGDQIKEAFKVIFHFHKTFEVLESNDLAVEMVVVTIIDNIKRDAQKRVRQTIANKENGKLGGRPTKQRPLVHDCETTPVNTPFIDQAKSIKKEPIVKIESKFEEFWKFYTPISCNGRVVAKDSKIKAEQEYNALLKKGERHEVIIAGLERYLNHCKKNNQLTKATFRFLKDQNYNDDFGSSVVSDTPGINKKGDEDSLMNTYNFLKSQSGGDW